MATEQAPATQPSFIPFSAIKATPQYQKADLDTKREYFKSWAQANFDKAGDDKALKIKILDAADAIRQSENLGSSLLESVGDIGTQVGLGLGGGFVGSAAGPAGTAVGGAAGSAAGSAIVQNRRQERGEQFGFSVGELAAEAALGALPGAKAAGTGLKAALKVGAKEGARAALIGGAGTAAREYETRGEIRPKVVATEAAMMGGGGLVIGSAAEGIGQLLRGYKLKKLSDKEFLKYAADNEELLTTNQIERARRVAKSNEATATNNKALRVAADTEEEVAQASIEAEKIRKAALADLQAEAKRRGLSFTGPAAGAEEGAAAGTLKSPTGDRIYVQDKDGNLVEVSQYPTQRAKDSADALMPDIIEATLAEGGAPRLTNKQALAGIGEAIDPNEAGVSPVDNLFAGNFIKDQDAVLGKLGLTVPEDGAARQSFRAFNEANVPKPAAESAKTLLPDIVGQADSAMSAGSMDQVSQQANNIAAPRVTSAVDDEIPALASDASAGYTIIPDTETGRFYLEAPDGTLVDDFESAEEAKGFLDDMLRKEGADAPLPDSPPLPDADPVKPVGYDDIPQSSVTSPNTSFEEYPRVQAPAIKGTPGKEAKRVPSLDGQPLLTPRQIERTQKRIRAIDKELESLADKPLRGSGARKNYQRVKQLNSQAALREERLQLLASMGDETAAKELATFNSQQEALSLNEGTASGTRGLTPEQESARKTLELANRASGNGGEANPTFKGEIKTLRESGVNLPYSTDLDALRQSVNEIRAENGLTDELETVTDLIDYLRTAADMQTAGEFEGLPLPKVVGEVPAPTPRAKRLARIEEVSAASPKDEESVAAGITARGTIPSAGESAIGAALGYFTTEKREGETDEAFDTRRKENALLGMAAGLALSSAATSRLAQKLGVKSLTTDLGAVAGGVAKKKTRDELLKEIREANIATAKANAGTPLEGVGAAVKAAVLAGPSPAFDPMAATKAIDQANFKARQGAEKTALDKIKETVSYFERKFVTAEQFVFRLAKQAEERAGRKFEASLDPEKITYLRGKNSGTIANAWLKQSGVADFFGKEVPEAAKQLGVSTDDYLSMMDKYLLSKHALNRYALGATEEQVGGGLTKELAGNFVASLAKDFEPAARKVNQWYSDLLDTAVEGGLVSRDLATWLRETYPDYVPFNRIFDGDEIAAGLGSFSGKSGKAEASIANQTVVQRFNGSERGIESPLEGLLGRAFQTYEQVGRNDTARSWVSIGQDKWLGEASGIKLLYRVGEDGMPLKADGGFVPLKEGNYLMIDKAGNEIKDAKGNPVVVDSSYVTKTDKGNWVGNGEVIRDRDAAAKAKHKISYLVDGQRLDAEVPREMEEAAKGLNVPAMGLFAKILNAPVRLGRVGFTGANPTFALRNIPRDLGQAVMNTKKFSDIPSLFGRIGENFAQSWVDAVKSRLGNTDSEMIKRWEQFGGRFNFTDALRPSAAQTLADKGGKRTISKLAGNVSFGDRAVNGFRKLEDAISTFEDMTRLAVFKQRVEQLAKEPLANGTIKRSADGVFEGDQNTIANIFADAAHESQERTANYLNRGEWGRSLNAVFLFLNAGIQGTRANLKAFRANPKAYALKALIGGVAALGTATYYNLSDPKRAEAYMNLTEDERSRNLILMHPAGLQDEDGNYFAIKIPLPQGISGLMQTPRRVVEEAYGMAAREGKPELFVEAGKDLFGFVTPFEPEANKMLAFATPQAVRPALEVSDTVNKNFFTGQMVVPKQLQGLPAEDQYTAKTSLTARELGQALGVSPIKLEYLARGYAGSLASMGLAAGDSAIGAVAGKAPVARGPAQDIVRSFGRARGGERLNRFYENFEESDMAYRGYMAAVKRGDAERAEEIKAEYGDALSLYDPLRRINAKMGEVYSAIRQVEGQAGGDEAAKQKRATELRNLLTMLADKGNELRDSRVKKEQP